MLTQPRRHGVEVGQGTRARGVELAGPAAQLPFQVACRLAEVAKPRRLPVHRVESSERIDQLHADRRS